jgi:hypothetical protein
MASPQYRRAGRVLLLALVLAAFGGCHGVLAAGVPDAFLAGGSFETTPAIAATQAAMTGDARSVAPPLPYGALAQASPGKRVAPPAAPAAAPTSQVSATPGTTTRDTELKAKPFVDAPTLARLPAKTAVTIVERRGGWVGVVSGSSRGWVRLLHVNSRPAGATGATAKELEAAARVATGRAGSGNIAVTTGIRGLTPEQLRSAQADPAALEKLERAAVEPAQASAYAAAHRLARRPLPYPPAPREARDAPR